MTISTPPAISDSSVSGSRSATQIVYNELRQRIIRGEIRPGKKLKVDELKALLNVGASPIREALSLLTSDQLVERIDQRGFRTTAASEAHFKEILTLRCQLETLALKTSIAEGDNSWEEQLVLSHHRLEKASRDDPGSINEEWENLHKAFHMALIGACGSPILCRFCNQLYDLNIRYRYLAVKSTRYGARDVNKEHSEILSSTLDRDADKATASLVRHYRRTGKFLAGQLAQTELID